MPQLLLCLAAQCFKHIRFAQVTPEQSADMSRPNGHALAQVPVEGWASDFAKVRNDRYDPE